MSRSYPIWNKVESCIYENKKSYGIKEHGELTCFIGTSPQRSYEFFKTKVTHRKLDKNNHEYKFYIDDVLIKKAKYSHKKDDMLIKKIE